MAIPPITNNPLPRLSGTDGKDEGEGSGKASGSAGTPEDIVEISRAAQQNLEGITPLSADNPEEVKTLAGDTRNLLEETDLTLGPDSEQD